MENSFIASTACDYDMPEHIIIAIYKKHSDDFYTALEQYLKD